MLSAFRLKSGWENEQRDVSSVFSAWGVFLNCLKLDFWSISAPKAGRCVFFAEYILVLLQPSFFYAVSSLLT